MSVFIHSGYVPPAAVVALAQRQFERPLEMLSSHPTYEVLLPGNDERPEFFETMYYGKHYQMGSLTTGHGYNLGGFKILTYNKDLGADFIIPSSNSGAPKYPKTRDESLRQRSNWPVRASCDLAKSRRQGYVISPPAHSAEVDQQSFATIFKTEKAYVALVPINLNFGAFSNKIGKQKQHKISRLLQADKAGEGIMGVVVVTGEGDYAAFVDMVRNGSVQQQDNTVTYQCASGKTLAVAMTTSKHPQVWRDVERTIGNSTTHCSNQRHDCW